jgi:hypothetical protein
VLSFAYCRYPRHLYFSDERRDIPSIIGNLHAGTDTDLVQQPSVVQVQSIERYQHRSIIHLVFTAYAFSVSLGRVRRRFMISLSLSPTTTRNVSPLYSSVICSREG